MGAGGLLGLLCYRPGDLPVYCLGMVVSISVAFVLTHILAKTSLNKDEEDYVSDNLEDIMEHNSLAEEKEAISRDTEVIINLPLSGEVFSVEESSDEMFAQKTMGDGILIRPVEGKVYAPEDCQIAFVFPTKHAVGLRTKSGITLLIHCGINTVKLDGKFFQSHVEEGQEVKKGTLLLEFDMEKVKEAGYSTETLVIATELEEQAKIQVLTKGMAEHGSQGFRITR